MAASSTLPQENTPRKSSVKRSGVLTISGFGIKVRMQSGHLEIEDGVGTERREIRLARVGHGLKRLVCISEDGFATFGALKWLSDVGASFVMLNRNGKVLFVTGPSSPSDVRLRRAQALAHSSGAAVRIARELIDKKLEGQERVARYKLLAVDAADAIHCSRSELAEADTVERVRSIESVAASAYWSAWRTLPINFPRKDQFRVPEHWRTFGTRVSPLTGSPRVAINPANAILNYLYAYDAVGNLTSKTDRKGQTIQYVYDALNRLTSKGYPDSSSANYVYDLVGKIKSVTDPTGTYSFAYDNMGRLTGTTTQYSFLPGQNFSTSYGYDAASNRNSFTAPNGSTDSYQYDTLNRLSTLSDSQTGQFGFSYDSLSRRTSLTRPNGINTSYSYDAVSHLLSVLHQAGSSTVDGAGYSYDAAGNRTSKTNYLDGTTANYTYDALYQLLQVTEGNVTSESYTYDVVGNRLTSQSVAAYNYNASNEMTSTSNATYTYDYNGNTLTKTDTTGTTQYAWDFENRLTSVTLPDTGNGPTVVTFKYDPFGRRIQKSGPLGTTNYLYDGADANANVIEEVDNTGNLLARYTLGKNADEPLAQLRSGTASYYQQDGLGSVTSLSSGAGAIAKTYTYDSYGKLTASTGTLTNPLQYTGRDFDSETGLFYNRARYLDPTTGRFLNEDPLSFDGGANFYAYVDNDPVDASDPDGLTRKDRWYGHNDPDFHKWFHRCWKQPGDPDAGKEGIEEAYEEWVRRGKPQGGRCWNEPKKDCKCNQKTTFEYQMDEQSNRYMEQFWKDILIGDVALGVVGTAGALGLLGEGCAGAGAAGGGAGNPPAPPAPPVPIPKPAPPIPLRPAA